MNTCDTCKWWRKEQDRDGFTDRECENPKIGYFSKGEDACICHDAEGYSGYITTGPKFGCIHWEAKE